MHHRISGFLMSVIDIVNIMNNISLSRGPLRCPFIGIPGYGTMGSSWWFHGDITDHWDRIRGDSKENIVGDER